jgi:hypothetical protein
MRMYEEFRRAYTGSCFVTFVQACLNSRLSIQVTYITNQLKSFHTAEAATGISSDMFSLDLSSGPAPFSHIVFVLDASFSMAGSPFRELKAAFVEFIQTRRGVLGCGQGMLAAENDLVTVIKFGAHAGVLCSKQPLRSVGLGLGNRDGGGPLDETNFSNALKLAHEKVRDNDNAIGNNLILKHPACL